MAGKNRLHEILKYDEEAETPGIVFFNNCRQIIADLPVIPSDPKVMISMSDIVATIPTTFDMVSCLDKSSSPFEEWGKNKTEAYRPASLKFGY